jgi:hypothetical protein
VLHREPTAVCVVLYVLRAVPRQWIESGGDSQSEDVLRARPRRISPGEARAHSGRRGGRARREASAAVHAHTGAALHNAERGVAMCAVVVSKTSCKDRNHRILLGVIAPHQDFFFFAKIMNFLDF